MKGPELIAAIKTEAEKVPGFWDNDEAFYLTQLKNILALIDNAPMEKAEAAAGKK